MVVLYILDLNTNIHYPSLKK